MVGYDGCIPDDLDNDGVPNTQDACPIHFGYSEHQGCAECLPGPELISCPCGSSVGWEGMCMCACNDDGMLEDNNTVNVIDDLENPSSSEGGLFPWGGVGVLFMVILLGMAWFSLQKRSKNG